MRLSTRTLAIGGLALVVLIVGAFVVGLAVGDDSGKVETLEGMLTAAEASVDDGERQLADAESELESVGEERDNLASQLAAEQDLSGDLPAAATGGDAPEADYVMGAAGRVGQFVMDPKIVRDSEEDGVTRWVATIVVKNNGSSPAELFCGDSGAELIDSAGRSFDAASILFENSANCGDAIQPGLTIDNYKMEFSLPADAVPAVLVLAGGEYGDGPYKSWAIAE